MIDTYQNQCHQRRNQDLHSTCSTAAAFAIRYLNGKDSNEALCFAVNPCKIGAPYRSQGVIVQCSAMNPGVCPAGHYCHFGADTTTTVCCQALGKFLSRKQVNVVVLVSTVTNNSSTEGHAATVLMRFRPGSGFGTQFLHTCAPA